MQDIRITVEIVKIGTVTEVTSKRQALCRIPCVGLFMGLKSVAQVSLGAVNESRPFPLRENNLTVHNIIQMK